MAEKKNIPAIRFCGFSVDWKVYNLGMITDCYSGGTPSVSNKLYYGESYPFIRSGEINSYYTELFLTEKGLRNSSAKLVKKGDILYALYGATSGEVGISNINGAINQAILAIKPKQDYNSYFLAYWLKKQKSSIVNTYLQGGQGNLSGNIVKDLEVSIPNYTEQTKIGDFFKQIDELITHNQAKYDKLVNVKKSMLEKMFPRAGADVPEIRFSGFTGAWVELTLGEHAIIKGRLGWKSLKHNEYLDEGPSMIAGRHIKNGVIDWSSVDYIPQWRYDESPEIKLKDDDVIFSKDGSLGNPSIIKNLQKKATINSTMMLVRLDSKINSDFFYQVLKTKQFENLIKLKVSGSSIPHLFQADMRKFRFSASTLSEQKKIGNYFKELDNVLNLQKQELEKLKTIKKAMLEKMFV
ncbi:MAG: restriction endonuclease subunit S [Marinifilaceae bacterium]